MAFKWNIRVCSPEKQAGPEERGRLVRLPVGDSCLRLCMEFCCAFFRAPENFSYSLGVPNVTTIVRMKIQPRKSDYSRNLKSSNLEACLNQSYKIWATKIQKTIRDNSKHFLPDFSWQTSIEAELYCSVSEAFMGIRWEPRMLSLY